MLSPDIAAVTQRFEAHAFAIRRLHAADPEFRAVCEDYAEAVGALALWRQDEARAEDYRLMVAELEAEILSLLGVPAARSGGTGEPR